MDSLILAYTNTTYRVFAPEPFDLRVGQQSPELFKLMQDTATECCAFLTAYNPWSIEHHVGFNLEQHAELIDAARPAPYFEGIGFHGPGDMPWLPERGILIMRQEYPDKAYLLARKFNQHAFLWCGEDAVPQLLLTRDTDTEEGLVGGAQRRARGG